MNWVWPLYEKYVYKRLKREGIVNPSESKLEKEFVMVLSGSTVTVLVQEPKGGSIRFKRLAVYDSTDMYGLLNDPVHFLVEHFGGGKFKLNFHHGWHFVATRNFKPEGDPLWMDLPEIDSRIAR